MKIAMSSDNHFDVNHVDLPEMIPRQAEYLIKNHISYYFMTGDLFNDFSKSIDYCEQLQAACAGLCHVYFIAGNHDMLNGVSYNELENTELHPQYLHHRILQIPNSPWCVVGNNGWYDYSLTSPELTHLSNSQLNNWKQHFWVDQRIDSPLSDQERMDRVLSQVDQDLKSSKKTGQQILFLTHFVPQQNYIFYQLDHSRWQIINAFLGSRRLTAILEKYHVQYAAFGHLHIRQSPQTINNITYLHKPLGYGLKRLFEWQQSDFFIEWYRTLITLKI